MCGPHLSGAAKRRSSLECLHVFSEMEATKGIPKFEPQKMPVDDDRLSGAAKRRLSLHFLQAYKREDTKGVLKCETHEMPVNDEVEKGKASEGSTSGRGKNAGSKCFPLRLHAMLNKAEEDDLESLVSWAPHGRCFVVHKKEAFVEEILPIYFRQSKWASFQRQLNLYGFSRLTSGLDKGGYFHEKFLRGMPSMSREITRMKIKGTKVRAKANPEAEPDFYSMKPLHTSIACAWTQSSKCSSDDCSRSTPVIEGQPTCSNKGSCPCFDNQTKVEITPPCPEIACAWTQPSKCSSDDCPRSTPVKKGQPTCSTEESCLHFDDETKVESTTPCPEVCSVLNEMSNPGRSEIEDSFKAIISEDEQKPVFAGMTKAFDDILDGSLDEEVQSSLDNLYASLGDKAMDDLLKDDYGLGQLLDTLME